MNKEKEK